MIRGMILQAGEIRIGEILLLVTRKQSYEFTGEMVWNTGSYYRFIKKKEKHRRGFEHSIDLSTCWGVLFLAGYLYWPILVGGFNPSD